MSVEDTVKHCVEASMEEDWDYSIEQYQDDENVVILHAHTGFLTSDLTEELRNRLIFVDATSSSGKDDYSVMYFLHYLEPEEDTFMDSLAEPVSTENTAENEEGNVNVELKTAAYSWIQNAPKGPSGDALTKEHPEEWCKDSNYTYESVDELAEKSNIHLWLADLKKAIDFDSHEEAEGARKLVEQAAFNLGTHGHQILQEELEEGDTQS